MTEDESDRAEWLLKLGGDLMFPPWMIDQTLTIPQYYGLWGRPSTKGLSAGAAVEMANKMRAQKGLPPLESKMPSCVKPIDPTKRRPKIKPTEGQTNGGRSKRPTGRPVR